MLSLGSLLSHEPVFARGGGLDAIASAANRGQADLPRLRGHEDSWPRPRLPLRFRPTQKTRDRGGILFRATHRIETSRRLPVADPRDECPRWHARGARVHREAGRPGRRGSQV
jgi:hypothetical protein